MGRNSTNTFVFDQNSNVTGHPVFLITALDALPGGLRILLPVGSGVVGGGLVVGGLVFCGSAMRHSGEGQKEPGGLGAVPEGPGTHAVSATCSTRRL